MCENIALGAASSEHCCHRAECKQPRPLHKQYERRPLVHILDGHDLDGAYVPQRECDVRPRCDVTRLPGTWTSLCAAGTTAFGEDLQRSVVRLDVRDGL